MNKLSKRQVFRKSVVWALIIAMVNPAWIAPALARDTDIFLSVTTGTTTAEPNVLLQLGTNDRMNIMEPWTEYPGAYDSHVEYLWNDINIISSTEVTAESASAISDAAAPINPFSPWGTWAGATLAARQAMWTAAKNSANATQTGDPGPAFMFRNYFNDSSWLYWLPTGTATTDLRLMSPTFNRFRAGPVNYVSGTRGGITFPPTAPTTPFNYTTVNSSFAALNLCASSIPQLQASTVMSPSNVTSNNGYLLNQQWIRYDPYLNLATVGNTGYPGSNTTTNAYVQGYLDTSYSPPTNGFSIPPLATATTAGAPYRDNAGTNGSQGQPIREQLSTVTSPTTTPTGLKSYAGWTNIAADLGGYTFQSLIQAYPYTYSLTGTNNSSYAVLQNVLSQYGITTQIGSSWLFTAWKGNRDAAPAFGMNTGTPSYYDTTTACNITTGPASTSSCVSFSFGGTSAQNATLTRNCAYTAAYSERDAAANLVTLGGSCATGTISCSDPRTAGAGYVAPHLNCGDITAPAACGTPSSQNQFLTQNINSNCAAAAQTPVVVGTCSWSGRQAILIEGTGYYYYGGSCQETGSGTASTASCTAGGSTLSLNGNSQNNVVGPYTPTQDSTTYRPGGVFNAAGNALGCSNAITAGTYNYGGTCSGGNKYNVSTVTTKTAYPTAAPNPNSTRTTTNPLTTCAFSGGSALTIRGNTQTYNRTCATTESNTNQTCTTRYGAQCDNSTALTNTNSTCAAQTSSIVAIAATSSNTYFYQAYKQAATSANLSYECLADGPSFNPGSNSYPTAYMRTFATAVNTNSTTTSTTNLTQAYTTNASQAFPADSTKNIDVYSVNYLNWKFGPKGPNGFPIGRKTRLQIAKDALSALVLNTNGVRFGLMVYNRTAANLTDMGGNIAYKVTRMGSNSSDPDYANRATLIAAINAVVASSRSPLTDTLYEAYRYFSGRTPVWGNSTVQTPPTAVNVSLGYDATAICTAADVTATPGLCPSTGLYKSPMLNNPTAAAPAGCQKNFVIAISSGNPEDDWDANTAIQSMSYAGALGTISPQTQLTSNPTTSDQFESAPGVPYGPQDLGGTSYSNGYVWFDELAYFMSQADISPGAQNLPGDPGNQDKIAGRQSVITYTIGFAGINSPVLANAANVSGGTYYLAQDSSSLSAALTAALVAIVQWQPTIAAPSVPISALDRSQNGSDVYLAFFQPTPTQAWLGTVKKFELGTTTTQCGSGVTLCLIGQTLLPSGNYNIDTTQVDPVSGTSSVIVDPNVSSFWGPTSLHDSGTPNQGGTGYQLINVSGYNPSTRKMYTFQSNGVSSSVALTASGNQVNMTNISKAVLGNASMSNAVQETLISYILGGNTSDSGCTDGSSATPCLTWRNWPHFDVQNSRPAVVTYDVTQNPPVQYMFYVSGDGLLHAVDANTGQEKWSFLIEEALPQIAAMMANNAGQEIQVADGAPEVYFHDVNGDGIINGTDQVWLYFGLRRGGRALYALDITQKDAPVFKWKITANSGSGKLCEGTSACSSASNYTELGQTWSNPSVGFIRSLGTSTPAVIFGGGYDTAEDSVPRGTLSMGRALYVVNGNDGTIVNSWGNGQSGTMLSGSATMSYPVPSDTTAINVDQNAQGFLQRVYVGDLGGNVWRFDINDPTPSNWTGKQLASLTDSSDASGEPRKIFFPPAAVKENSPIRFDAVYVGTGDYEHPLLTSTTTPKTTTDKMFMIMDRDVGLTASTGAPASYNAGNFIELSETTTTGASPTLLTNKSGWYRDLDNGEKVTSAPTVIFNQLQFGTYAPLAQNNACTPPGSGRLNDIDALYGAYLPINSTTCSCANDRFYSGFVTSSYISTGQLIVVGTNVYQINVSDAQLHTSLVGSLGTATKIYWYLEPEQ